MKGAQTDPWIALNSKNVYYKSNNDGYQYTNIMQVYETWNLSVRQMLEMHIVTASSGVISLLLTNMLLSLLHHLRIV